MTNPIIGNVIIFTPFLTVFNAFHSPTHGVWYVKEGPITWMVGGEVKKFMDDFQHQDTSMLLQIDILHCQ